MEIPNNKIPLANFEVVSNDDPTLETISLTIFVAGCVRRCVECQNPDLQIVTYKNSKLVSLEYIKKLIIDKTCLIRSVVFCGGDFLPLYKNQLKELVIFCKKLKLKTILYTGELFENIDEYFKYNIDIIIDGPYMNDKKNNKFPVSYNQRCFIDGKITNCNNLKING